MNAKLSWLMACGFFLSWNVFSSMDPLLEMSLVEPSDHDNNRCSYIYDEWQCDRTNGCYWNHRRDYCASEFDDGGDHRSCHHIYSPLECSNRHDCYWSRGQQRCISNNGGGGGSPRRCYSIRSPYECNNTYNCHWSNAYDRCVGPDDI